jgi:hypothetical protein
MTRLRALLALALASWAGAAGAGEDGRARDAFAIRTLSSPAHLVSGGTALVSVEPSPGARRDRVRVRVGGRDVTAAFHARPDGTLLGVLTDLPLGASTVEVLDGRRVAAALDLTNHRITGPMISGPHQRPFVCQTDRFTLPDGTSLGPPLDADCSAPTRVHHVYLPAGASAFRPMPDPARLPADVATIRTRAGVEMPFVVRVETATVNRGIYQTAVLHDPTREPAPTPFAPPRGWSGRLVATQGFGCTGGWYVQRDARTGGDGSGLALLDAARLREGDATVANTLQHPSTSCNPVLAGETLLMSKARFVVTFGAPRVTVSVGCSGGAYTSLQIADALPGLLDGVLVSCTFPDAVSIALAGSDANLLRRYFEVTNPTGFTEAQQVAVSGYQGMRAWQEAANQARRTDPVPGRAGAQPATWSPAVPVELRYDPVTNRSGARPTIYDAVRNVYGVDPATGFALRPFDNVGVQYGLGALTSGVITKAQFLALNEGIGGYDQDARHLSSRSVGDGDAIRRMQAGGVSLCGGGGLADIPVLDVSGVMEETSGYHHQWFHFAVRERLREWNGDAANHVMWRGDPVPAARAWATFIEWVDAVQADGSAVPRREKVLRNKPREAVDGCWTSATTFVAEPQTFGRAPASVCNARFPSYGFPRLVAGGPLSADVFACALKPLEAADYAVSFTAPEWARLEAAFPDGVCDASRTGRHRARVVPWASFGPSPANLVFDVSAVARATPPPQVRPESGPTRWRSTDPAGDALRSRASSGRPRAAQR